MSEKPRLTKEARALLAKTFVAMRKHAETFDMNIWMAHEDGGEKKAPRPYCGTTACLAGHIVLAAGVKPEMVDTMGDVPKCHLSRRLRRIAAGRLEYSWIGVSDLAEVLLGVGDLHGVFHLSEWPGPYQEAYHAATTPKAKVNIAIARVRHWMKTGE